MMKEMLRNVAVRAAGMLMVAVLAGCCSCLGAAGFGAGFAAGWERAGC